MNFWKRKKKIDVNTPIVNPGLKKAINIFNSNKSEKTLQIFSDELRKANFLVLIDTKELKLSNSNGAEKILFEKGSIIKFLRIFDENNEPFLPIFTDWNEIDQWIESRENIAGWIMSTNDVFNFVLKNKSDKGLVINVCSDKWEMSKEQIAVFLNETQN